MKVKKHIVISLILLLAISTQAFASPKNNIPAKDEKVEVNEETVVNEVNKANEVKEVKVETVVNEKTEVTEKNELEQSTMDSDEKQKVESPGEITNNPDEDNSTDAEKLCWYCTKYIYGGGEPCTKSSGEIDNPASSSLSDEAITPSDFQTDCYVPKYKMCVDGFWSPNCRLQ